MKKENTIDGSKATITAWDKDGSSIFQCDSTQDPLTEVKASKIFEGILNAEHGGIFYAGGSVYNIDCGIGMSDSYSVDIETGEMLDRSTSAADVMRRNSLYRHRTGLVYHDENNYQSGFYDLQDNLVIDLSEYHVQAENSFGNPCFINGYAVLRLLNSDSVPFWGVMKEDGSWQMEPQKGNAHAILPLGDGVLIVVGSSEDGFQAFNETGENLGPQWEESFIARGYEKEPCENYNGYLYTNITGRVAKIDADGNIEFLQ